MRQAPAILALLALSGCVSAGPRAPAPSAAAVAPPPGWRTTLAQGGPIAAEWWNGFGDPALAALVARALANNPDVEIAAARVDEARAAEALARAQLSPQVGGTVPETQGQTLSPLGTPSRAFGAQPALTASFDLDLFGRLRLASRAARAQLLASEGARDTVRLAVAASAASGYITLRALDERLAIARQTLAARDDALRIARRRFETGYSSRLEYRQAQAEYQATAQLLPAAELAISRQENSLSVLTGDAPRAIARGLPLDRIGRPAIPAGLPADLLRRRPDLFQAEQTLVAADLTLDSQRAAFLPNLALTGNVGVVLSTALSNPVGVFSLGASVLAPIFDGGRLRAQEAAATARRDQAAFSYRRTALTALREVDDALAGVQRSGEQASALERQTAAASGALQNATNRYRAGYSSYLEQLDAQRNLLNAELTLVQARADRLTSNVALFQAMGGGWSPAEVSATGGAARAAPPVPRPAEP
ncbi:efflux transporter, outer membrane factor (OMF) lipoprotein, NodT family [Sphingomonas gellani]|uniref:Efflux transporter, outer membrane factor (OMF) lipoprotein, NodT family n=1 Tax=Sphingomonas gellani TaxID=1166340 RepID=A0A1H8F871_9SPHN|nr:efflux transporter outer membrane subunit [Sphingomonas gellani]SEN28043.1 efflux transporter, outer membrane factor (OMF) lipoprotein, NodT family [Sphingomonas gellani]